MRLFVPGAAYRETPKAKQRAMARTKPLASSWNTRLPKGPTPISKDWRRSI